MDKNFIDAPDLRVGAATGATAAASAASSMLARSGVFEGLLQLPRSNMTRNLTTNLTTLLESMGVDDEDDENEEMPFTVHGAYWFLGIVFFVLIVFEVAHTIVLSSEFNADRSVEREMDTGARWDLWRNLKVSRPYFAKEGKVRGTFLLVIAWFMTTFNVFMSYGINILIGRYWDALNMKDWEEFMMSMKMFIAVSIVDLLMSAYKEYIMRMLHIHWRESLSRHYWKLWLADSNHYRGAFVPPKLENPDQRIQVDCGGYVSLTTDLTFGLYFNVFSLALFLPLLYHMSPPGPLPNWQVEGWLCYVVFLYALFGQLMVHLIGRRMINLQYGAEQSEADFRSRLVTVRDESDTVGLLGAEEREKEELGGLFLYIRGIFWSTSSLQRRLDFFHSFYTLFSHMGPIIIMAPAYFGGYFKMGTLLQTRNALNHVEHNVSWGISAYSNIAEWSMVSSRLQQLDEKCETTSTEVARLRAARRGADEGTLSATNASFSTPDGKILLQNFNLQVRGWILITGPEGCGKTTLLRYLRGLWPGTGEINGEASFLPVSGKCLSLRRGDLKTAVAYPDQPDEFTTEQVESALRKVGLENLDITEEAEWGQRLSSGQFARLQLAHVILKNPTTLVLDEPTAHCAPGEPAALFQILKTEVPNLKNVLTITHQAEELMQFHDELYRVDVESKSLVTLPRR